MNVLPPSKFLICSLLLLSRLLTSSAQGADIRFVPSKPNAKTLTAWAHVEITGEIAEGDVQKLRQALAQLAAARNLKGVNPFVILDTPGGSVPVALQMGTILRDSLAHTAVVRGGSCSSSGVFLFAAGVIRNVFSGGRIGLHRPRFESERFANLTSEQGRATYDTLADACANYMKKMGISDQVFSDMLKVPSQDIRFVDRIYAEKHGLIGTDPAWEEWLRAKDIQDEGEALVKARDRLLKRIKNGEEVEEAHRLYEKEVRELR